MDEMGGVKLPPGLQYIEYRYLVKPMIKSFRSKDTQEGLRVDSFWSLSVRLIQE